MYVCMRVCIYVFMSEWLGLFSVIRYFNTRSIVLICSLVRVCNLDTMRTCMYACMYLTSYMVAFVHTSLFMMYVCINIVYVEGGIEFKIKSVASIRRRKTKEINPF